MSKHHPDWQEPGNYPPMSCKDLPHLAWEFLRRNERYAVHVEQMQQLAEGEYRNGLKITSHSSLNGLVCWPPAEPGESARQYYIRTNDKKIGKKGTVIRPWKTFVNQWSLDVPVPVETEYDPKFIRFLPHDVAFARNRTLHAQLFKLVLFSNEVALRFRVDRRLPPQLATAKKKLETAVKEFETARLALNEAPSKASLPLLSLRKFRKSRTEVENDRDKSTHEKAHYWLRCYDALSQKLALEGTKASEPIPTEADVRKFLNDESKSDTALLLRSDPSAYQKAATSYIDGMRYLLLLDGL